MSAIITGYTVSAGTSEELGNITARFNNYGQNVAYEAALWDVADSLKEFLEGLYPLLTFVNSVVRHEAEDVTLTHP